MKILMEALRAFKKAVGHGSSKVREMLLKEGGKGVLVMKRCKVWQHCHLW